MRRAHPAFTASLVVMTWLMIPPIMASGVDLHRLWDDRCAVCHGHAGDFAREYLSLSAGSLQGRHHADDLRRFLHNHYLAGREVDAVYGMLLAQVQTQARFRNECSGCHATAARFVREALLLDGGALYGRASGRPVRGFLEHHRDLEPEEVDFYTRLLTRVAGEVYRP